MISGGRQAGFYSLVLCLLVGSAAHADGLGRLFTTVEQREQLQISRNRIPKPEIVLEEMISPDSSPAEPEWLQPIRVKGIVYRSDGRHTAWINDGNTLAGDLALQPIRVHNADIQPDRVRITLPDNQTRITVKVGERYDPQSPPDERAK